MASRVTQLRINGWVETNIRWDEVQTRSTCIRLETAILVWVIGRISMGKDDIKLLFTLLLVYSNTASSARLRSRSETPYSIMTNGQNLVSHFELNRRIFEIYSIAIRRLVWVKIRYKYRWFSPCWIWQKVGKFANYSFILRELQGFATCHVKLCN